MKARPKLALTLLVAVAAGLAALTACSSQAFTPTPSSSTPTVTSNPGRPFADSTRHDQRRPPRPYLHRPPRPYLRRPHAYTCADVSTPIPRRPPLPIPEPDSHPDPHPHAYSHSDSYPDARTGLLPLPPRLPPHPDSHPNAHTHSNAEAHPPTRSTEHWLQGCF